MKKSQITSEEISSCKFALTFSPVFKGFSTDYVIFKDYDYVYMYALCMQYKCKHRSLWTEETSFLLTSQTHTDMRCQIMQDEYPGMPSATFYPLLLSFSLFVVLSTILNSFHCPSSILGQVEWVAHSSCHGRFWSWVNRGDRSPSRWAFYEINISHITNSILVDKFQRLF